MNYKTFLEGEKSLTKRISEDTNFILVSNLKKQIN